MKRIGIFAGTFDPIHEGHISFALATIDTAGLNEVLFLPERLPPHKVGVSAIEKREKQILQATANNPYLQLYSTPLSPITYKELLPLVTRDFPNSAFYLLTGSDVAMNISQWKNIDQLVKDWPIIIGLREGQPEDEVRKILEVIGASFSLVRTSHAHVSSSQYKNRRVGD